MKPPLPVQPVESFPALTDQLSVELPISDIELDTVRQLGELLVRRRDEIALENSPAAAELEMEMKRVTATMNEVSAKPRGCV